MWARAVLASLILGRVLIENPTQWLLQSESDPLAARQRNDAMGQKETRKCLSMVRLQSTCTRRTRASRAIPRDATLPHIRSNRPVP